MVEIFQYILQKYAKQQQQQQAKQNSVGHVERCIQLKMHYLVSENLGKMDSMYLG